MKIRLLDIAHARSGDKGDTANVGLIALKPEWYEVLRKYVTRDAATAHFEGVIEGPVERYELPNLKALNFLLHGALDGGGTLSLESGSVFIARRPAIPRAQKLPGAGGMRWASKVY